MVLRTKTLLHSGYLWFPGWVITIFKDNLLVEQIKLKNLLLAKKNSNLRQHISSGKFSFISLIVS